MNSVMFSKIFPIFRSYLLLLANSVFLVILYISTLNKKVVFDTSNVILKLFLLRNSNEDLPPCNFRNMGSTASVILRLLRDIHHFDFKKSIRTIKIRLKNSFNKLIVSIILKS